MFKRFVLQDLFEKKTIKGVPKKEENLDENPDGYHVFGQNIKYQYSHRVLMNEKYLQVVEPDKPILAYTSSVGEIGMITESFYRTGDNGAFQGLFPKMNIDIKPMMYLLTILRKHFNGFGYSTSMKNIMNLCFELPVIESSDPGHKYTVDDIDWQYMQERIAELEQERIAALEQERIAALDTYLRVTGLDDYELTGEDRKVLSLYTKCASNEANNLEADSQDRRIRLRKYALGDLFEASTGDVDLQKKDINGKGQYLINSGVDNRGIKGRTDRPAKIFPANTITIDFWGNAYYRDFEYKMATHNHVFSLAGNVIKNKHVGMYIVGMLSKLPMLFSYDNMATWNKLKVLEISLPVTIAGDIDFDYMEHYIRAIEKLAIADVVKYKDKMIATTKQVVAGF